MSVDEKSELNEIGKSKFEMGTSLSIPNGATRRLPLTKLQNCRMEKREKSCVSLNRLTSSVGNSLACTPHRYLQLGFASNDH